MAVFVSYCRVSTNRQGISGLGLAAQEDAVSRHVLSVGGKIVGTYIEVESGAAKKRPQLELALAHCRDAKAVLLIAKLDRLARNVAFIASLMEAGADFIAVDAPYANKLMLHVMAAFAEFESEQISARTKAALAAAKARGVKLGLNGRKLATRNRECAREHATLVEPAIKVAQAAGCTTLQAIADYLNKRSVPTATDGIWYPTTVARVQRRLDCSRRTLRSAD